jgi:hypothetical protein
MVFDLKQPRKRTLQIPLYTSFIIMSVHTLMPLLYVSTHVKWGFRGLPQRCEVAGERYFALLAILMYAHFVLYKNKMSAQNILTNICSLLYDCLALKQSAPVG